MTNKSVNLPLPLVKRPLILNLRRIILPLLLKSLLRPQHPRNAMHNPLHLKQLPQRQLHFYRIFNMEGNFLARGNFQLCLGVVEFPASRRGVEVRGEFGYISSRHTIVLRGHGHPPKLRGEGFPVLGAGDGL